MDIVIGLERLVGDQRDLLAGRRFALLMNRASVDRDVRLACDVLHEIFPGGFVSLMTPQHGLWGEQQANMIESGHGFHVGIGVPVHSLYSETRRPTDAMLAGIDCLVIDLQDVGTRVYTYIWTVLYCLQKCASRGIAVIVLDRPNPIGGQVVEGPQLQLRYRSFVGEAAIPMRHGLTIGELSRYFNREFAIGADLTVVPMLGWRREFWFDQLNRVWVPPSPNMPTLQTAIVYPGQVLLEGTNLSEGRGTTVPFEVVGAPYLDPDRFCQAMNAAGLAGVRFLPIRYTPSFDKFRGDSCGGVSIHVTDRDRFRSWEMTATLLTLCQRLYPNEFRFIDPPYEYEYQLMPIDIISGSDALRQGILSAGEPPPGEVSNWHEEIGNALLY